MFDVAQGKCADGARRDTKWSTFTRVFLQSFVTGLALIYLFILLVDPFGNGWFPALPIAGTDDRDPRTADVYRGRDQRFDSAIIGNSTGQLLSPARLANLNGFKFVQLTIPGSGPREQLTVWRWFAVHHKAIKAIVLVADASWCTDDPTLPIQHPFPFWLYSERWFDYGINIFSMLSLDRAVRRLGLALGLLKPSDPTGYSDYEAGRVTSFSPEARSITSPAVPAEVDVNQGFPGIDRLDQIVAELPSTATVIIVAPPVFVSSLPQAGTSEAERMHVCKSRLAKTVAERRHGGFIDMLRDLPLAHNSANFMDASHYRRTVAQLIETQIAAILTNTTSETPIH